MNVMTIDYLQILASATFTCMRFSDLTLVTHPKLYPPLRWSPANVWGAFPLCTNSPMKPPGF
jgi:hypothetical protein